MICVLISFIKAYYIVGTHLNYLDKFIKAYVVGTHLNCIDKLMQFKWIPTTLCYYKVVDNINGLQSDTYEIA